MDKTQKIAIAIGATLLAGGIAFPCIWTGVNWKKVHEINPNLIYSQEDMKNAEDKAYSNAFADKVEKETEIAKLNNDIKILQAENQTLSEKSEIEKQQITEKLNSQISSLKTSLEDSNKRCTELQTEITNKDNQIATLTNEINNKNTELSSKEKEIADLNKEIENWSTNSQLWIEARDRYKSLYEEYEAKYNTASATVTELTNEKTRLENNLSQLQNDVNALESEKQQLENNIADLNRQIGNLTANNENVKTERDNYKNLYEEYQTKYNNAAANVTELTNEKAQLENIVSQLQGTIATLETEKQQLESEKAALEYEHMVLPVKTSIMQLTIKRCEDDLSTLENLVNNNSISSWKVRSKNAIFYFCDNSTKTLTNCGHSVDSGDYVVFIPAQKTAEEVMQTFILNSSNGFMFKDSNNEIVKDKTSLIGSLYTLTFEDVKVTFIVSGDVSCDGEVNGLDKTALQSWNENNFNEQIEIFNDYSWLSYDINRDGKFDDFDKQCLDCYLEYAVEFYKDFDIVWNFDVEDKIIELKENFVETASLQNRIQELETQLAESNNTNALLQAEIDSLQNETVEYGLFDVDGNVFCSWDDLKRLGLITVNGNTLSNVLFDQFTYDGLIFKISNEITEWTGTFMGRYFEKIIIPGSVTNISCSIDIMRLNKLKFCEGVTTLDFLQKFCDCHLVELDLPGSLVNLDYAFCENLNFLKKIILHEGLQTISRNTFCDLIHLETIEIPESVTSLDFYTFSGCNCLKEIKIPKNVINFTYDIEEFSSITLHGLEKIIIDTKNITLDNFYNELISHSYTSKVLVSKEVATYFLSQDSYSEFFQSHDFVEIDENYLEVVNK